MSELINNSGSRKDLLKHMILQLHEGAAPEQVKRRLMELMAKIPYGEVVEVEQELISEGLPEEEVLRLCDVHTEVLEGRIDLSGMQIVAPGHPVDTFKRENRELEKVVAKLNTLYEGIGENTAGVAAGEWVNQVKALFNALTDVDKHYRRKENLLFPFLERYGITGPPTVMWGKHDETRDLLKDALGALDMAEGATPEMLKMKVELNLKPASKAITDMIMKEEEILFPMTLDKLNNSDWYEIYRQTNEIGYCLYDPQVDWKPEGIVEAGGVQDDQDQVSLPSGRFTGEELMAILNTMPFDVTFVDRNDKVKYFSQGRERIFDRNRAILGRDVRMCHPPSSVHIVDKIISDFKNGSADSAPFWIQMHGKFIHIEYFALRNEKGEYLGTLEVSQDLTEKRKLAGDQRILSYRTMEKKPEGAAQENPREESLRPEGYPEWWSDDKIRIRLDARPLLSQGIHPLERVMQEAGALAPGEIFEILTPFPPTPMIERMSEAGFDTFSAPDASGLFRTYFAKR